MHVGPYFIFLGVSCFYADFLPVWMMDGVCQCVDHLHLIDVRSSDFVGHGGVVRMGFASRGNITLGTQFTRTTILALYSI